MNEETPPKEQESKLYPVFTKLGLFFYFSIGALLGFVAGEVIAHEPIGGMFIGVICGWAFHQYGAGRLDDWRQKQG